VPVAGRAHVSGVSTRRLFTASMRSSPRSLRIARSTGWPGAGHGLAPMNQKRATCSPSAPAVWFHARRGSCSPPRVRRPWCRSVGLGPANRQLTVEGARQRSHERRSEVAIQLTDHLSNVHPRVSQHVYRSLSRHDYPTETPQPASGNTPVASCRVRRALRLRGGCETAERRRRGTNWGRGRACGSSRSPTGRPVFVRDWECPPDRGGQR